MLEDHIYDVDTESQTVKAYVPAVTSSPLTLAARLLLHKNPAARSALFLAAGGVALSPLDYLLSRFERYDFAAREIQSPRLMLVCGPPRSGTTLVSQFLINHLEVSYINNLSSLFPRAPLLANRALCKWVKPKPASYSAYYGRSRHLSGTNDGLHIWDRWLGPDRSSTPRELAPGAVEDMPGFFSAWQTLYGIPTVNKVNRLFSCIDLVAPVLPDSYFVCLRRDPVMLAQSLLIARKEISGNLHQVYGLRHEDIDETDPVEDVCRQVIYYQNLTLSLQQGQYGDRVTVLDYEQFCDNPQKLLTLLETNVGYPLNRRDHTEIKHRFEVSRRRRVSEAEFEQLQHRLAGRQLTIC